MRTHSRMGSLAAIVLLAAMTVPVAEASQRGGQRRGFGSRQGGAPGGGMGSSFEANSPAVGEAMPDVVVHRETGEPVSFRQLLSDHYTVVIFGCLT